MTNREAIQELAGMYRVVVTDNLTSTIEAEDKNTAIDMAIAALEAQEPRVLTLEEVRGTLKQPIWKEVCSSHKYLYTGWVLAYDIQTGQGITGTRLGMAEPSGRIVWYRLEDYGTKWRCWTSRPTEEQRRDTPWE